MDDSLVRGLRVLPDNIAFPACAGFTALDRLAEFFPFRNRAVQHGRDHLVIAVEIVVYIDCLTAAVGLVQDAVVRRNRSRGCWLSVAAQLVSPVGIQFPTVGPVFRAFLAAFPDSN